jgi:hypothetical protein
MIIKIFDRAHYGNQIGGKLKEFRLWKISCLNYVNSVFQNDEKFKKRWNFMNFKINIITNLMS